ncbi:hypothetical protein K431DRAFT_285955 [Polychaeton citri CBS 116435]|uniref:Alpha-taxilin n=1 Tax=Polychaeton citri CBS 116435 TaxID=1314669 RepID=A0A9P4Q6P4_9PEZI|nr:hypothetical protein K431DRAFT_285955 [Polychaeton citri CBS 116435]
MSSVVNQQQPQHSHAPSRDFSHDSGLAPPPPPATAPAPAPIKSKSSKKNKNNAPPDPNDAHKALLSKISQLEASSTESAHETAEIEAEVKKANRDLSQLLTTLEPHNSKLDVVQRKYSELLGEMKRVEREHAKAKKRGDQLQKEKEEIGKERTKERTMKEKLEKLSRELTRENKKLKEDLRDLKDSSADRNEELHRRLEGLVLDVEDVVSDRKTPERASEAVEWDRVFREKFQSFLQQYELREIHFQSLLRVKDLEIKWHAAQNERLKKTQENELSKSHQLTRQVSTFSQTENELRGQLNVYVEKFKQVEDTLNNSNDLFLTFRKEMEEMSKKTKRLEKENLNLTRKQEATNKNIFQMAEERSQSQAAIDRLTKENEKLKGLCRAMQSGGYGTTAAHPPAGGVHHPHHHVQGTGAEFVDDHEGLEGETESEYDEEEYDEGDDDDDEEYDDDDTEEEEEEGIEVRVPVEQPRVYGPPPPPPPGHSVIPQQEMLPNGKGKATAVQMNGIPNGVRH